MARKTKTKLSAQDSTEDQSIQKVESTNLNVEKELMKAPKSSPTKVGYDIVNMGQELVRVKFYRTAKDGSKVGDVCVIPLGGLRFGKYPEEVLQSKHFKTLTDPSKSILRIRKAR